MRRGEPVISLPAWWNGLIDQPHPGQQKKVGEAPVAKIIRLRRESQPQGAIHRSTEAIYAVAPIAHFRFWLCSMNLQPQRQPWACLFPANP